MQVRDLFKECERNDPSKLARMHLSILSDGNFLKPTVWAEDANNPKENFGTSLGVRPYLKPLYLYIKLCDLRKGSNVALRDLKTFRCVDRYCRQYNAQHRTGFEAEITPCASCQIFFSNFEGEKAINFNNFGNCAEFDIIGTQDSREKLRDIKEKDLWSNFKSACEKHYDAFNKLRERMRFQRLKTEDIMLEYYEKTQNTNLKNLGYKWIPSTHDYELVTRDYIIVS